MEFALDNGNALYQIKSYQRGFIKVNEHTYDYPILVTPIKLLAPWGPHSIETLSEADIELLLPFKPQVVLIGTGTKLCFPNPKLFVSLMEANIGFEIMDTAAACRTYTVLRAEGRNIAAGLFN